MAKQAITTTPTALTGLDLDTNYTLQFRATCKSYVQSSTAAPTDGSEAFVVGGNGVVTIKRTGSNNVYVWAEEAGGSAVFAPSV